MLSISGISQEEHINILFLTHTRLYTAVTRPVPPPLWPVCPDLLADLFLPMVTCLFNCVQALIRAIRNELHCEAGDLFSPLLFFFFFSVLHPNRAVPQAAMWLITWV